MCVCVYVCVCVWGGSSVVLLVQLCAKVLRLNLTIVGLTLLLDHMHMHMQLAHVRYWKQHVGSRHACWTYPSQNGDVVA